eukprot:NODE_469_length_7049_cov_0.468489.p9 type:complete len:126 gc:universal NODE_469_length_7049_cov_0.468489:2054-1677(-)
MAKINRKPKLKNCLFACLGGLFSKFLTGVRILSLRGSSINAESFLLFFGIKYITSFSKIISSSNNTTPFLTHTPSPSMDFDSRTRRQALFVPINSISKDFENITSFIRNYSKPSDYASIKCNCPR